MQGVLSASIIIRSKDRIDHLRELVKICLGQSYPSFEVMIVDSTEGLTSDELGRQLRLDDRRVTIVRMPPRGCAAAANEGVRRARGEVLAFVDDDDIPVGPTWLATHLRNYDDANCLGVAGGMIFEGTTAPWLLSATPGATRRLLSFGFFKNARWYSPVPTRKVGIEFLMGGNASLRRSTYERGGGWDEFLPSHNECSLFLRLAKTMSPSEYLVYDPDARMRIRRNIPGGVNQRVDQDLRKYVDTLARYYLWVVAKSHPLRIYGLFPLFALHFVLSTVSSSRRFLMQQNVGKAEIAKGYGRALGYAPIALAKHLIQRPPLR